MRQICSLGQVDSKDLESLAIIWMLQIIIPIIKALIARSPKLKIAQEQICWTCIRRSSKMHFKGCFLDKWIRISPSSAVLPSENTKEVAPSSQIAAEQLTWLARWDQLQQKQNQRPQGILKENLHQGNQSSTLESSSAKIRMFRAKNQFTKWRYWNKTKQRKTSLWQSKFQITIAYQTRNWKQSILKWSNLQQNKVSR